MLPDNNLHLKVARTLKQTDRGDFYRVALGNQRLLRYSSDTYLCHIRKG